MESSGQYVGAMSLAAPDGPATLEPVPTAARVKKMFYVAAATLLVFLVLWGLTALTEWRWLRWSRWIGGGIVLVGGAWMAWTAKFAPCPYCKKSVGIAGDTMLSSSDENVRVECDGCHELLLSHQGQLRALDESDTKVGQKLDAPLFTGGKWPAECIVCGKPATRHEDAQKTSVEFSSLLVGRLAVGQASVSNIPYCDEHEKAVSLTKKDDHVRVVFNDLGARRRYLKVNEGNQFVK